MPYDTFPIDLVDWQVWGTSLKVSCTVKLRATTGVSLSCGQIGSTRLTLRLVLC